ncbi:hypothetical protein TNCV_3638081 [Trichonephila clavipes]|nr:hypothetical protein TNCV_3638081 [Trichonephila clavipes]
MLSVRPDFKGISIFLTFTGQQNDYCHLLDKLNDSLEQKRSAGWMAWFWFQWPSAPKIAGALGKSKYLRKFRIVRSQVPPSGEETGRQNYLRQLVSPIWCRTKKGYQLLGNVLGLQRIPDPLRESLYKVVQKPRWTEKIAICPL